MKKINILILMLLFLIVGCSSKNIQSDNAKMNNNENIIKEQTINNLIMNNVSLSYKDGISTFRVQITNNTTESISINQFNVIFKTENDSIITTLNGFLGDSLSGGESFNLTITSDIDLSEAYSLEYQID